MLKCNDIRCEYLFCPTTLDEEMPRFSWKLVSDVSDTVQTAYEIKVGDVWDSGKVISDRSVNVVYDGEKLNPLTMYNVKIRVWDNHGNVSDYAETFFKTGFLEGSRINAKFITCDKDLGEISPVFKKSFSVKENIKSATLYGSAYGVYESFVNGERVSDTYLSPGYTSYNKRLQYQSFDIKDMLCDGKNEIKILWGKGWAFGRISDCDERNLYDRIPSVLAEVHIEYCDGSKEIIKTDKTWDCASSPLLFSEFYDGEIYDFNLEGKEEYFPCKVLNYDKNNLIGQSCEYVRVIKEFEPIEVLVTPKGERVIDFGQNIAGFAVIKIKGKKGDVVSVSHAEVLDKDGNFYTENLRSAKQKTTYILSGDKERELKPHFAFQGFRYIRLDEFPEEINPENFKAYAISTDMEYTSSFKCSNPLLNKLYENVLWSQRDNFIDIPTDCPQRDERAGWTGDAQVFTPTAMRNAMAAPFYTKWLSDLAADQHEDGGVPVVIPMSVSYWRCTSALYSDAATICPYEVYKAYGDTKILEKQYSSMKKWVEYIRNTGENEYLWDTGFQYGDWLALDNKEGDFKGRTPEELVATAYYAHSTEILSKAAKILGYDEDASKYSLLFENVKKAFINKFFDDEGNLYCDTQTAHALALSFGLTDVPDKTAAVLCALVKNNGGALNTGFAGTHNLCSALSDNGCVKEAYDLLLRTEYPSWLYSVSAGATTIWEHWDGIKPDGSMWDKVMNSFNHYAYGSIFDWVFGNVLGIEIDENIPGYKHTIINPKIDKRLDFAGGSVNSLYGEIAVSWEKKEKGIEYTITIPPNITADFVPLGKKLGSGQHVFII